MPITEKYAIVLTTINSPNAALRSIVENAFRLSAEVIIIGDTKSPKDFRLDGSTYWDVDTQLSSGFRYAKTAPFKHYARKNVGYLKAIQNGATVIIETDDDNIPRSDFWKQRQRRQKANVIDTGEWINTYAYFTEGVIWPRGLPLERIRNIIPTFADLKISEVDCPIQQGLADENPDVDAIYRLTYPLPFSFNSAPPIALQNVWCPFNSQNTTWMRDAFPLLYLPYHCSFRMTDIWRSFIAQRIAYVEGWSILFHNSTVCQDRNDHSLIKDFEDEIPGYLHNAKIRELLIALPIRPGDIAGSMRRCYLELIKHSLIGADEMTLLDAWLEDIKAGTSQ